VSVSSISPTVAALEWEQIIFPGVAYSWNEFQFLRQEWSGPIVIEGIQSAADAELAVQAVADGIIVSDHGGGQYDGAIDALEALREIVEVVNGRVEVFDSGILSGADVIKAISLAKAVFIGRPVVYGLGAKGEQEVLHVLKSLLAVSHNINPAFRQLMIT
jgi:isopentenyl diphosphate isomerase/L-lactate dehydrogenase-like FMN-dependent dehydrogenase